MRFGLFIQGYNKILLKDANEWDSFTNSQWVVRIYTASKLILSSNLLLENVIYGRRKNSRISEPYLLYYALLCCCRSVVLTSALQPYDKIFPEKELTHEKTINISIDILKKFNKQKGVEWGDVIKKARMQREIFSYNFPSSGLSIFGCKIIKLEEIIDICRVLSEIAQLQSSIVQRFVEKRNLQTVLNATPIYERCIYGDEKESYEDNEDMIRLLDILRKWNQPFSVINTMSEGWVEDFFGAWSAEDFQQDADVFNPDENWHLIFPVP